MSYADKVFVKNVKEILENGVWDTDREVRPKWKDGTPAHTVKKFCLVNRYDLSKEFPIRSLTTWIFPILKRFAALRFTLMNVMEARGEKLFFLPRVFCFCLLLRIPVSRRWQSFLRRRG